METGAVVFLYRCQECAFNQCFCDLDLKPGGFQGPGVRDSGPPGSRRVLFIDRLSGNSSLRLCRPVGSGRHRIKADPGAAPSYHNGTVDNGEIDGFPYGKFQERAFRSCRRRGYLNLPDDLIDLKDRIARFLDIKEILSLDRPAVGDHPGIEGDEGGGNIAGMHGDALVDGAEYGVIAVVARHGEALIASLADAG